MQPLQSDPAAARTAGMPDGSNEKSLSMAHRGAIYVLFYLLEAQLL